LTFYKSMSLEGFVNLLMKVISVSGSFSSVLERKVLIKLFYVHFSNIRDEECQKSWKNRSFPSKQPNTVLLLELLGLLMNSLQNLFSLSQLHVIIVEVV